ncbi:alpha/beta hydrolase [Aquimarina algicola]|uniref:Alpha/beta hydrolase n=1 Tax=Aquimarina algicola TaxID=2589995 RepID=A0A504JEB5_9FLAO|nr:alpha/beta hydrolase-fold protein [Aquimarina algicola]TPN86785.1 alpha/beta hydrolase [Aquimarina algicola]
MKIQYQHIIILFLVLVFTGCKNDSKEINALRIKNELLEKQLKEAKEQSKTIEYQKNNTSVALPNTTVKEITSKFNGQKYKIKIQFPRGYKDDSREEYPVLYVIDAETNFGGVGYIVQRLIKDKLIPQIIVVGIAYDTDYKTFYKLRSRDLTPVEDNKLKIGGAKKPDPTGGASEFCDFLEKELFPFIEGNFNVKKQDRALYGHSYGGLFGSYVLLEKSHLFNKYILLGSSLWYKSNLLISQVKHKELNINQTKLYMGSGELEGRIDDLQTTFIALLKAKKLKDLDIKSEVIDNETHRTIFGVGFTNGLRFVYSK